MSQRDGPLRQEDCNLPFDSFQEYDSEGRIIKSNRLCLEAYAEALRLNLDTLKYFQKKGRVIDLSVGNDLELRGTF